MAHPEPVDLRSVAAALSADLTREGISHAITGSIAMAAHGVVRGTLDLDVLVVAPSLRLPRVFELVRARGFSGEDRALVLALRERGVASLRHGPVSIEILVPGIPYHETLIGRATRVRIDSVEVPFVSLEDLIVLKLCWSRAKDLADLESLVSLDRARLDTAYIRHTLDTLLPPGDARLPHLDRLLG